MKAGEAKEHMSENEDKNAVKDKVRPENAKTVLSVRLDKERT